MSLHYIHSFAREQPAQPAVVFNGNVVSYAGFAGAIVETARYLETLNLPAGHTVIVKAGILIDCWAVVLALQSLGLQTVCLSSSELIEKLAFANVVGIATTELEASQQLQSNLPTGTTLITVPNPSYKHAVAPELPSFAKKAPPGGHILYTSGTTGTYKKILWAGDLQQRRNEERIQGKTAFDANSIYHCLDFGLWTAAGYKNPPATWQAGGCVVIDQRPEWSRHFLTQPITHCTLTPEKLHQLLDFVHAQEAPLPARDFHLQVSGGFVSRKLAEQVLTHLTSKFENIYGSTETSGLVLQSMVADLDDMHWLLPTSRREVEIVDESGMPCPVDVEGQLRVRLTDLDCSSYMDDPLTSAKVFRDGCFYPGDMALRRADGRIRILGRSADVLNVRGRKLSVAPIEHDLQHRLGVNAVCLFSGMNSAGEDEVVIVMECAQWPPQATLNGLGQAFPQFERVRMALLHQFPRTHSGFSKIDRIALRKLIFPTASE